MAVGAGHGGRQAQEEEVTGGRLHRLREVLGTLLDLGGLTDVTGNRVFSSVGVSIRGGVSSDHQAGW